MINLTNTLIQQEIHSEVYACVKERNIEKLKNFVFTTPRMSYDWYSNDHDNFISFFFHNKEKPSITFNGVTKQELIEIYKEAGEFLGQNLFNMDKPNGYFG